ncbi:metallophosphoesterase [Propionivibrio sp.]|uniref:metallophosphoesterase n=1 Tax=Propionivibrio sp. TaxID=2212460 RepID=UPI003BF25E3F
MKIALFSDIHNNAGLGVPWVPPASAEDSDLVILAGDIGGHTHGLAWASNAFPVTPVAYVAGNHEYYGAHLGLLDELRRSAKNFGVSFLEQDVLTLEKHGVRILGCTLWSGFDLYGSCEQQGLAMAAARRCINDYRMISARGAQCLEPRDTAALYRKAVSWLEEALAQPFDGKTVVVTHFAPHRGCIAPQHEGDSLTPYFVSDMAWLIKKHKIDVWCYGHTHTNTDFMAENGCRVVSNQLGYPGERTRTPGGIIFDTGFRGDLLIEV